MDLSSVSPDSPFVALVGVLTAAVIALGFSVTPSIIARDFSVPAFMIGGVVGLFCGGLAGWASSSYVSYTTYSADLSDTLREEVAEVYGLDLSEDEVSSLSEGLRQGVEEELAGEELRTLGSATVEDRDGEEVTVHLAWVDGDWMLLGDDLEKSELDRV